MRIRNGAGNHPQRSISHPLEPPSPPPYNKPTFSPTTKAMNATPFSSLPSEQPPPPPPHVMVSRINARISSIDDGNGSDSKDTFVTASPFAQDETNTGDSWSMSTEESFGHSIFGQTQTLTSSSVSSSLFSNGRWCEEDRAIPLKKRRIVTVGYETKQSKEMVMMMKENALEERKREMGEIMEGYDDEIKRCNRGNGKGWRCNKTRMKGHNLCKHHLEMQRMRNTNNCPCSSRNQEEEQEQEQEGSFDVSGRGTQVRENKRDRVVKARSMSSLLRDTVPLFYC